MKDFEPSEWALAQFGDQAKAVITSVVVGLHRAQQAAWRVQAAATAEGIRNKRAYGSMWDSRYNLVVQQFDLAHLPGYRPFHPRGAPYKLALVNDRVLIPFRHSTSLAKSIHRAKIRADVPLRVSRGLGVEASPTLFDLPEPEAEPSLQDAAIAAHQANLTVVYVGFVANADADRVLEAWWGEAIALEDNGRIMWSPEKLPVDAVEPGDYEQDEAPGALPGTGGPDPAADGGKPPVLRLVRGAGPAGA
ncbi:MULTISPECIES: hypothetical protein [Actinosynnema]|uniref:hypothetical protein n=1 Tax=Actinosynnema TaxID=40566 RepID=UPI0020A30DC4|nr:hypothetical protein [Actinosynnema pretiosum]MCP2097945.1 hypothetical protein [Actinosynnema pretiosum]